METNFRELINELGRHEFDIEQHEAMCPSAWQQEGLEILKESRDKIIDQIEDLDFVGKIREAGL